MKRSFLYLLALCLSVGVIHADGCKTDLLLTAQPIGNATFKEFYLPCETPVPENASRLLRVCQLERKHCHGAQSFTGIATKVKVKPCHQYCVTAVGRLSDHTQSDIKIYLKQKGCQVIASTESFTNDFRILTLKFIARKQKVTLGLGTTTGLEGSFEVHKFTLEECDECPFKPLTIVCTNDDGYNDANLGIQTLASVLQTAGHNVYIVAPASRVDGCSAAVSSTELTIPGINTDYIIAEKISPDIVPNVPTWAVSTIAAPDPLLPAGPSAFSVPSVAQFPFVLAAENPLNPTIQPDLIISGINIEANNTGPSTINSGTVMAALATSSRAFASFTAVPSIAVSGPGAPFIPGLNAPIAEFVLNLVTQLQCSEFCKKNGKLLPDFVTLNVNWPATATPNGVRITRQGLIDFYLAGVPYGVAYINTHAGTSTKIITVAFAEPMPASETADIPDSDSLAIAQNYIAITPIDPFLSADPCETRQVINALAKLQPAFGTFVPETTSFPFSKCKKSCK